MPSRRQERVAKRVMQELVEAFRDLKNANFGFITITKCEVAPDLRHAKVFVSVWGDEKEQERNLSLLRHNASRLRGMIGRPLGTKVVPELHFEFDASVETADRMYRLIREARKTDINPNPLTPEEVEALQAAASSKGRGGKPVPSDGGDEDLFEAARQDVEEELFGDEAEDDPDWKPINLDELPDDDEGSEDRKDG